MYKFNVSDVLYVHSDNSEVTVVKKYPCSPKMEPTYLVRHHASGTEYNEREMYLYKNKSIYPDAKFRVGEIVYYIPKRGRGKIVRYEIIEIFFDAELCDEILYRCKDSEGNIEEYPYYELTLYDFAFIARL